MPHLSTVGGAQLRAAHARSGSPLMHNTTDPLPTSPPAKSRRPAHQGPATFDSNLIDPDFTVRFDEHAAHLRKRRPKTGLVSVLKYPTAGCLRCRVTPNHRLIMRLRVERFAKSANGLICCNKKGIDSLQVTSDQR